MVLSFFWFWALFFHSEIQGAFQYLSEPQGLFTTPEIDMFQIVDLYLEEGMVLHKTQNPLQK